MCGHCGWDNKKTAPVKTGAVFCLQLFSLVDAGLLAILAQTLETEHAVHLGEQGIVSADTDVLAGMDAGAALADQDVAGLDELTVGALGTQALGLRVTAVLGGAAALLVGEELKTNTDHDTDHPFLEILDGEESIFLQNLDVVGELVMELGKVDHQARQKLSLIHI